MVSRPPRKRHPRDENARERGDPSLVRGACPAIRGRALAGARCPRHLASNPGSPAPAPRGGFPRWPRGCGGNAARVTEALARSTDDAEALFRARKVVPLRVVTPSAARGLSGRCTSARGRARAWKVLRLSASGRPTRPKGVPFRGRPEEVQRRSPQGMTPTYSRAQRGSEWASRPRTPRQRARGRAFRRLDAWRRWSGLLIILRRRISPLACRRGRR